MECSYRRKDGLDVGKIFGYSSLFGNFTSFPDSINIVENPDKVIKELSTDQKNCYSYRLLKAMKTRVLPKS